MSHMCPRHCILVLLDCTSNTPAFLYFLKDFVGYTVHPMIKINTHTHTTISTAICPGESGLSGFSLILKAVKVSFLCTGCPVPFHFAEFQLAEFHLNNEKFQKTNPNT